MTFGDTMSAVLATALVFLGNMYRIIHGMNVWLALGLSIGAMWFGGRLTGHGATVSGQVVNGQLINGTFSPAVEGTAQTFLGRLVGLVLQLLGFIGFGMSLYSVFLDH